MNRGLSKIFTAAVSISFLVTISASAQTLFVLFHEGFENSIVRALLSSNDPRVGTHLITGANEPYCLAKPY